LEVTTTPEGPALGEVHHADSLFAASTDLRDCHSLFLSVSDMA
jgi:hypothetical protein